MNKNQQGDVSVADSFVLKFGRRQNDIDGILEKACAMFGVTLGDLKGRCRKRNMVHARVYAVAMFREQMDLPFAEIGRYINRDHSSVMHLWKKCVQSAKE